MVKTTTTKNMIGPDVQETKSFPEVRFRPSSPPRFPTTATNASVRVCFQSELCRVLVVRASSLALHAHVRTRTGHLLFLETEEVAMVQLLSARVCVWCVQARMSRAARPFPNDEELIMAEAGRDASDHAVAEAPLSARPRNAASMATNPEPSPCQCARIIVAAN